MTLTADIRATSELVAQDLGKVGIKAKAYARSPIGGSEVFFSIALDDQNVLRIWAGTAQITVIPADRSKASENFRQAVLQVYEKDRTIKKVHQLKRSEHEDFWIQDRVRNSWIERNLGVFLPSSAVYSVVSFDRKSEEDVRAQRATLSAANDFITVPDYGTITIQGQVSTTRQNFLVGADEHSQFISALPRVAKSVKDAHDALRPAGVSRSALRQGEWFFVPATRDEKAAIKRAIEGRGRQGLYGTKDEYGSRAILRRRSIGELESGSSHHAPSQIRVNNRLYAVGVVYDTRPNRHGQLVLPDWHRVIRNREIEAATVSGQNTARWD